MASSPRQKRDEPYANVHTCRQETSCIPAERQAMRISPDDAADNNGPSRAPHRARHAPAGADPAVLQPAAAIDRREADEAGQHTILCRRPVQQLVEQRIAYERARVGTERGGYAVAREIVDDGPQRQTGPICGRAVLDDRLEPRQRVVASGRAAFIRFVAQRSIATLCAACLRPVAITMSGRVASKVSSNVGQALAKLTGSATVLMDTLASCSGSSTSDGSPMPSRTSASGTSYDGLTSMFS